MVIDPKKEAAKSVQQELNPIEPENALDHKEVREAFERQAGQEKTEHQNIRAAIEAIKLDDSQATQTQAHADDAALLAEEEKITRLFELARKKGVIFAVHTAKKMNNPYVLDMLHDRLAKEGHYKEFLK